MKYTTESDAPDRNREEVRPGHPFIEFSTKPAVNVVLDNPIQMSGLFRVNLAISDGDTTKSVLKKLAKSIELKGKAINEFLNKLLTINCLQMLLV